MPIIPVEDNKDIRFIAERYRHGRFSTKEGWRRLGIAPSPLWRRVRIAAVAGSIIVLSATAAIVCHQFATGNQPPTEMTGPTPVSPAYVVKVIDFEDTPLPVVTERIKEVYGVEVTNLPENAEDFRLSLHYEGSAIDLVETINDILDTKMSVKQQ